MHHNVSISQGVVITFIAAGDVEYSESKPETFLRVSSRDAYDLFVWLGIPNSSRDFGFLDLPDLRARCMRRLWPIPRNTDPEVSEKKETLPSGHVRVTREGRPEGYLRSKTEELLRLIERASKIDGPDGGGLLYNS